MTVLYVNPDCLIRENLVLTVLYVTVLYVNLVLTVLYVPSLSSTFRGRASRSTGRPSASPTPEEPELYTEYTIQTTEYINLQEECTVLNTECTLHLKPLLSQEGIT